MTLFDLLAGKYPDHSAAALAAALGVSRQAYAQAAARGRLSDAAALRAAALLEIDPGAALLANITGQHPAPPKTNPTTQPVSDAAECQANNTNYAKSARSMQIVEQRRGHASGKTDRMKSPISSNPAGLENITKPQGGMETHITDIAHVIQLSVAPVFLLTAISTLIGAMNARLGRIIDRRRVITEIHSNKETTPEDVDELVLLARRRHLIYLAILFAVIAALLVCFVVAGAFLGALIAADLTRLVAALFILAMGSMIAALSLFLREIYLAVSAGSR